MTAPLHPRHNAIAELDAQIAEAEITRDRCLQDLAALPGARRARILLRVAEERLDRLRRSRVALLAEKEQRSVAGARPNGGGQGAPRSPSRVSKSMRVGAVPRTSIELEAEFWGYLIELAAARGVRPSALVAEVAAAKPRGSTLASALRVFALEQARRRLAPPVSRGRVG
jgi:predicted DNA-binding ribbon-helix-helix protein